MFEPVARRRRKAIGQAGKGSVIIDIPAAKRQRDSVPAEMPLPVIMTSPVATQVKTTDMPPPLASRQTSTNEDEEEAGETVIPAKLGGETMRNATTFAAFLQYPQKVTPLPVTKGIHPRLSQIRPPRFSQATLDSLVFYEEQVAGSGM